MLRIFSGDNLIISIIVEQTPSKNPYTDSSLWTKQLRRHKQQEANPDQYLKAIWPLVSAVSLLSPMPYIYLFSAEAGWNLLRWARPRGRDQWRRVWGFLRLGSSTGEWIRCLEVWDHSAAYSHGPVSICRNNPDLLLSAQMGWSSIHPVWGWTWGSKSASGPLNFNCNSYSSSHSR